MKNVTKPSKVKKTGITLKEHIEIIFESREEIKKGNYITLDEFLIREDKTKNI